jgi:hypothetical protein
MVAICPSQTRNCPHSRFKYLNTSP